MIKVEVKNSVSFPDAFLIQEDLYHIATKIFLPYLTYYIDNKIKISGGSQIPDCENTIEIKRALKAPAPSHPLFGFELKLRTAFTAKRQGKNSVVVSLTGDRKEIGERLQIEGVVSRQYGRRWFRFFGINATMEAEGITYVKEKIHKLIAKFNGK